MDLYDENFKIQDMIDSDMRSLRSELGEYFTSDISCSPGSSQLEALTPAMPMDTLDSTLDSELSNDGRTGWMNSSQLFNMSADFDSIGGLLVNPQTALPVSLSDSLILSTSRTVATSDAAVTLVAEKTQDAQTHISTSGGSITVTLPVQVITTTALVSSDVNERTSQVNLTVAVPTPSPSPHNLTQQQFSSQDSEISPDICDSPKPKSKNKTVKPSQHIKLENAYPKPAYSYSCLIAMALKNSKTGSLPVNEIYDFMTENFPYFKTAPNGWKNSVRHNLSLNKCFEKIEKPTGNSAQRKGYLWAMNPAKVEKMEEELQKWGSKDPVAIRKSMANPERLELIEKGELKHDLIGDMKDTLQVASETKLFKSEKGGHFKIISVGNLNSDLINSDFPSMGETVNIDPCLPELDLQKGIWENLCEDRLQFLSDSPANPLSPETMDDDSSLDSVPSNQQPAPRSFIRANYIYKRASDTSNNKRPLLTHSSIKQEQSAMCDA